MGKIVKKILEKDLEEGIKNNEFKIYMQPKFDVKTEQIVGAEALIRRERQGGLIMPNSFIPDYEKTSVITKLDMFVFESVCRKMHEWKEKNYKLIPISINQSRKVLYNKNHIKELDDIVLETLNKHIQLVCDIENKIDDLISFSKVEYNIEVKKLRLEEIEKELKQYKDLLDELVKDYKFDFISQEDYDDFKQQYLYEINKLNIEKEELSKSKINTYNLKWLEKFKKAGTIEIIDRNIVDDFIENIFVNDDRSVEILFRYRDQYNDAIKYLKNQKNMI